LFHGRATAHDTDEEMQGRMMPALLDRETLIVCLMLSSNA